MPTQLRCAWGLTLLFTVQLVASEEEWPGWRGPSGMGLTPSRGLPVTWGGDPGENVLWKSPLPGTTDKSKLDHNQSSPIVWGDRIFLMTAFWPEGVATTEFPEHRVACFQASDGRVLWNVAVPPGPLKLSDLRGGYSAPTPCTDGERVYVLFGSSQLAALDFDGRIVWRKEVAPYGWDVAVGTSPVLFQETVLVLADGAQAKNSRLIAFDRRTGAVQWERPRPTSGFSHSTPVLATVDGRRQLLIAASQAVQGLDPADGRVLWWVNHPGDVPSPVFDGGLVYSENGRGGPGVAIDPRGEGDVGATHVKWKTTPVPESYSSAVVAGEYVFRPHPPGILRGWRLSDGELVHKERLPPDVNMTASPFVTPEGLVYLVSGGVSAVIQPGPELKLLATNDLGDPSAASPAVSRGRIYIKGGKHLYCVGKK